MRISDCSSDVCSSDLRMVNAYAMLANQGRQLTPKLMDYVQDRRGKVIWPLRWRACDGCNMANWDGKPMPRFGFEGRSEEHTSELQSLMRISYAVFCLKKKKKKGVKTKHYNKPCRI